MLLGFLQVIGQINGPYFSLWSAFCIGHYLITLNVLSGIFNCICHVKYPLFLPVKFIKNWDYTLKINAPLHSLQHFLVIRRNCYYHVHNEFKGTCTMYY